MPDTSDDDQLLKSLSKAERDSLDTGKSTLDPKDPDTKERYFRIYERHIGRGESMQEIAKEDGISYSYVSQIIRWCRSELKQPTGGPALEDLIHRLVSKRRKYAEIIAVEESKGDKCNAFVLLSALKEDRANDVVLAKIKGWLQTKVEIGDKTIQVLLPDCAKPMDAAQADAEIVDVTPNKEAENG